MNIEEEKRSSKAMARTGRALPILSFTDHFENCVNAISRLLRLLDRLKSEPISGTIPRDTRKAIKALSRELIDVRDAVEHVDERIQRGEIGQGQPMMVFVDDSGDQAVIGPHKIRFDHTATTLRKLHEIGQLLFDTGGRPGP